ncbi:DUF159-domain-containing protein, partial [Polychaeton citri CBS 116435]
MCGRYALSFRPSIVRHRLAEQNMPAEEAPDDDSDEVRTSYNFAPSYHGLIYRAQPPSDRDSPQEDNTDDASGEPSPKRIKRSHGQSETTGGRPTVDGRTKHETKYKLQAAKWGLVPSWTKRLPDYGTQMRTINCRDDSLAHSGGRWNTMKQRKRCIVVAEGFYEWLKKNGGKDKMPHFVKRKDGGLMCFAGLWDSVHFDNAPEGELLYTYTIITTDSNKQLQFLHDRMPVIMEPGSTEMKTWLDPERVGWDRELQQMLKPFNGELECYPVDRAVGKVGNNSPQFVVPIDSKENRSNIANFFGNQASKSSPQKVKKEESEQREMVEQNDGTEDNAPLPKPQSESAERLEQAIKSEDAESEGSDLLEAGKQTDEKQTKPEQCGISGEELLGA